MTIQPRLKPVATTAVAVGCACVLAACGSSSSSSSSAASGGTGPGSGGGATRVGLKLTTSERACLKKHGVSLGTGAGGRGAGNAPGANGGGTPPTGANGAPGATATGAQGRRPKNLKRGAMPKGARGRFGADFAKRQAAFKACGVTLPTGGSGGPGGGAPPTG